MKTPAILPVLAASLLMAVASWASAMEVVVPAERGALVRAIAGANPGDVLILEPGRHDGPVHLDFPITLDGLGKAEIDGGGQGSVITVAGDDITVRGLTIIGSGNSHETIDSGIQLKRGAAGALIEGNKILGNLYGVDVHGAVDAMVRGNTIVGRKDHRMNDRGNGVYVWNAPGTVVEGNDISLGRDGIFVNTSNDGVFRDNLFRQLRFAVHYMYANNSEVSGNVSIGNHLGFALMFSNRISIHDNISLSDHSYGLMLNYANNVDMRGNIVRGAIEKCLFIYNAHKNAIEDNRFENCGVGIHFTAGSELNLFSGNAFINNRNQVKYVGTRQIEWSDQGRGNYWSDHPAFDLNGDGIADSAFHPNDLMDHILWSQPAAKLLLGSPAVQLVRWSQAAFPALLPGGVVDSHPLMQPPSFEIPEGYVEIETLARSTWLLERTDDDDIDLETGL
jgi:nitrous oxidase accessory protein